MKKIVLHIPHASAHFPSKKNFTVSEEVLQEEVLKLTDWYTDELFEFEKGIPIKANFSRIYCDPERFTDDSKEVMALRGMGVLYERTEDGLRLRNVTATMRKEILEAYYYPHHKRLENAVYQQFNKFKKALIVDCHSFPNEPLPRALNKSSNRPDFNIGTEPFHTPEYLVSTAKKFFQEKGYTLGVDWPFKGSIVPLKYYQRSFDVNSIMLEVNRSLYLERGSNQKSTSFEQIKKVVQEFLEVMHETYYGNDDDFTEKNMQFREFKNQNLAGFTDFLRSKSNEDLINCFNNEVNNSGWGNMRSIYLIALGRELRNRNFGGVMVSHEKGLSLNRKVKLIDNNLAFVCK